MELRGARFLCDECGRFTVYACRDRLGIGWLVCACGNVSDTYLVDVTPTEPEAT